MVLSKQFAALVLYTSLLLLCCKLTFAQQNQTSLSFQHLPGGLSQSSANVIYEDSFGYLWIGTRNGLNKYDGKNFRIYEQALDNKTGLTNGYIEDIYEDDDRQLYIGTVQGLNVYHRDMDILKPYPFIGEGKKIALEHFYSVVKSTDFLWLGTTSSLFRYHITTGNIKEFKYQEATSNVEKSNYFVKIVKLDSEKTVVIIDKDIWLLNNELQVLSKLHENQRIRSVIQQSSSTFLIGLHNGELIELKIKNDNSLNVERKNICNGYPILSLAIANNGDYWIGSENDGLFIYSKSTKQLSNLKYDNTNNNSISSNSIWSIYNSKGIMWLAPYRKGLSFYDPIYHKFKHIKNHPFDSQSLNNNNINCYIEDINNNTDHLWIGTDGGGLSYWDRTTNTFEKYSLDHKNLNANVVISILQDKKNKLWLGSWGKGITIFNLKNKNYEVLTKENSFLLSDNVFNLKMDSKGRIWIATFYGGLQLYDPETKTHKNINLKNTINNTKVSTITNISEDTKGNIWVGTQISGLYKLVETNDEWQFKSYNSQENEHFISNDFINAIVEDSKGTLWVGTQAGLNKYDYKTGSFQSITRKDGLKNDAVKGIIEDENHLLWLSTGFGIIQYNPENEVSINYDINDGLQGNEFNSNSFYKTRNNELIFGGSNGFNLFKAKNINKRQDKPKVNITSLKIFNKTIYAGDASKILKRHISQVDSITLSYDNDVINFEFNALTFRHPDKVNYAYFLDGFETDWNYVGHKKNATYTSLEPGEYILRIKSSNSDGIWNNNETKLHITITPPYWETWWFRLLITILLISSIYLFLYLRVKNIKKYQLTLEKKIDERTQQLQQQKKELKKVADELITKNKEIQRFTFAVSHDLKSPLSGIKGIASLIPKKDYPELETHLDMINISCDTMNNLIADITKIAKIGKIENKNEILDTNEIVALSTTLVKGKLEVSKVKLIVENNLPNIYGDRNRIIQVFGNLLDNAIKYMGDQKQPVIYIKAQENGEKTQFSVLDNGSGMDERSLKKLFTPFERFHSNVKGTGLGLYMIKEIIESHNGIIYAESEGKEKGTTFTVILPNIKSQQIKNKINNDIITKNTDD
ncbi:GHKL domain-containing protein [Cellulophaga sp. HaHaR_3_176]|uniref:ligand-binding sensor domain-containing protein n=1 Tax=Cellulophaga sp. HaHaR_3_176 TaxID=1942464 RepID=UPI001C1F54B6|nr:sensor histidine kinase [Cellulophaga sp. HaHaR_3_176]QWX85507.1 GHKL domain-containing protein [Cellulophaga sp. HaHaR_3_176]